MSDRAKSYIAIVALINKMLLYMQCFTIEIA